jgi:hypothetical protein
MQHDQREQIRAGEGVQQLDAPRVREMQPEHGERTEDDAGEQNNVVHAG